MDRWLRIALGIDRNSPYDWRCTVHAILTVRVASLVFTSPIGLNFPSLSFSYSKMRNRAA